MSDSKSSYGDPVDEPKPEGDVVGRAHEGLADAEAAGLDAVPAPAEPAPAEPVPAEPAAPPVFVEPEQTPVSDAAAWFDRPLDETPGAAEPETVVVAAPVETTVVTEQAVLVPEPVAQPVVSAAPGLAVDPSLQPIFVQAPEPPRPRGNRGAAGLIGVLAAVVFGVVLLGFDLLIGLVFNGVDAGELGGRSIQALLSWAFWVPVVVFFLAFWILGALINRGRWGHWVVWGLLVGVASYVGFLLGQLFQAPFWQLTAREGADLLQAVVLAPLAIVSFVVGRELTIWFGAWVAARGKRITELNEAAQREYERTLEAGPQLYQQ